MERPALPASGADLGAVEIDWDLPAGWESRRWTVRLVGEDAQGHANRIRALAATGRVPLAADALRFANWLEGRA